MENVITLSKLIDLSILFCPPLLSILCENSKNTRNELARPVIGTIFLVMSVVSKMRRWNYLAQTHACSKSVFGWLTDLYYSFRLCTRAALAWTIKKRSLRYGKLLKRASETEDRGKKG